MTTRDELLQAAKDAKDQPKIDAAYEASLTSTEMAPKPAQKPAPKPAPTPKPKKLAEGGRTDTTQDKAMIKKAFKQHDAQKHKGGSGTSLKLAKGGVTRADGCITKGHTKGRMV